MGGKRKKGRNRHNPPRQRGKPARRPEREVGPSVVAPEPLPVADAAISPTETTKAPAKASPPILRVWRHPNYALFEGGWLPQSITTWIQRVGVLWLAWELSHSNTWVGAVAAADLAPMIVLAPLAGAMADRMADPMRLLVLTKILMLVQAVALAAAMYAGVMTIELLFVLSLVTGVIHPFSSAARQIVLAGTVPREDFPAAIALDSALFQASRFIGPAIAAVMIAMWDVASTFLAHVFGSLVLLVALTFMRVAPVPRPARMRRSLLIDIADSVGYTRGNAAIWPLFLLLIVTSMLLRPVQELLPGFASKVFGAGAEGLGWLASSMGVGATLSATWIALRGRLEGLSTLAIAGALILVVSTLGFAMVDDLRLGLVLIGLSAFGINTMSTSIQTITQSVVADGMRGRVMSLYSLIFRGLPAVGALGLGSLADRIGLQPTFQLMAVLAMVVWVLVALKWRAIAEAVRRQAA